MKSGKFSTEADKFLGNRGNLKQGEMHHCLGDGRPCKIVKIRLTRQMSLGNVKVCTTNVHCSISFYTSCTTQKTQSHFCVWLHAYMRAYVRACVYVCLYVLACACLAAYMCALPSLWLKLKCRISWARDTTGGRRCLRCDP